MKLYGSAAPQAELMVNDFMWIFDKVLPDPRQDNSCLDDIRA
jgi:hypothetical protein